MEPSASTASVFALVKPSSWRFIGLSAVALFVFVFALNLSFTYADWPFAAAYAATGHLVTPTLMGAGALAVLIVAGLVYLGKLPLRDFGWKREYLVPGLAATVVLWIVMQVVEVIANVSMNGRFAFSPSWANLGAATVIGVLIGQFFGTAVAEETYFRGFLLPQLRIKFNRMSAAVAVGVAIAISQIAFALYHLPNLVLGVSDRVGTGFTDIAIQLALDFAIGLVFAAVYIRTGNLFLVMGIHALQNAGTSAVATPVDPALVVFGLAIILFLATFTPAILRRFRGARPAQRSARPAHT